MSSNDLEPVAGEIVRAAPLLPMAPAQAESAMSAYQDLTRSVLDSSDWIGRPGEPESFVKRSGWQKLATFYGVSTELVGEALERDGDGNLTRAAARVRAIARDGRHAEGGGACGRNEPRFRQTSGRQKIEHDLPATAETRATNRAISNLIGFGAVSAEEVDADVRAKAGESGSGLLPHWAEDIPPDAVDRVGGYLDTILAAGAGDSGDWSQREALRIGNGLTTYCDGTFPKAAARLAALLARAIDPPPAPGVPPLDAEETAAAAPDVPPQEG